MNGFRLNILKVYTRQFKDKCKFGSYWLKTIHNLREAQGRQRRDLMAGTHFIRGVQGSNIGPEPGCPEVLSFFLSPSRQMTDSGT
jgi:hypothetical protein